MKPQPIYKYSSYVYYDVFGQIGLGVQKQFENNFSLDLSLFRLNNNIFIKNFIAHEDYYDYSGYGFCITPKFMPARLNQFYIGFNLGFQTMSHEAVKWEKYTGSGDPRFNFIEERKGYGVIGGVVVGSKVCVRKLAIEPFLCLGLSSVTYSYKNYYYSTNYGKPSSINYPANGNGIYAYLHSNLGVKIGYSFKKDKRHVKIDEKFDAVFIPEVNALKNEIKTRVVEKKPISVFLIAAKGYTEGLNSKFLKIYKSNYLDTTKFYTEVSKSISKVKGLLDLERVQNIVYKPIAS